MYCWCVKDSAVCHSWQQWLVAGLLGPSVTVRVRVRVRVRARAGNGFFPSLFSFSFLSQHLGVYVRLKHRVSRTSWITLGYSVTFEVPLDNPCFLTREHSSKLKAASI